MDRELIAYLDTHFQQVDGRFQLLTERFEQLDERFQQIDRRFETIDRRLETIEGRLQGLDDSVRQTNVLVEALRSDVHLIAEGSVGLNDRFERFQSEATLVFDQVKGWIEPYYRNLDGRLKIVEGRAERQQGDVLDAVRRMLGKPPLQPLPAAD